MKVGLLSAIVVAVLLLSSLLYWKARPVEGPLPALRSQPAEAASESPVVLSDGPAAPEDSPRAAAAPAADAPPAIAADLASGTRAGPGSAVPPSMPATDEPGDEVFEGRYAEVGTDARRAALESLRAQLEQGGEAGKGQPLTEKEILAIKREIEWLTGHESP